MTMLRIILFCAITPLLLAPGRPMHGASEHRISEQADGLFENIGDGSSPGKLSDISHYEKAERNGSLYYVILRSNGRRTWLTVFCCDSNGAVRAIKTIADKKLLPVTAIMGASFAADGRLDIDTHVSPRLSIAVVFEASTGRWTISQTAD
jgi:hypothetical protein